MMGALQLWPNTSKLRTEESQSTTGFQKYQNLPVSKLLCSGSLLSTSYDVFGMPASLGGCSALQRWKQQSLCLVRRGHAAPCFSLEPQASPAQYNSLGLMEN
jgi:hypothetical protein